MTPTSPSVTSILGQAATPHTITHNGKTYTASFVTQKLKSAVEQELKQRRLGPLYEMANHLPAKVVSEALTIAVKEIARGEWSFLSENGQAFLSSKEGGVVMVALIFSISVDEALALMMARPIEVQATVELVIAQSFPDPTKGETKAN